MKLNKSYLKAKKYTIIRQGDDDKKNSWILDNKINFFILFLEQLGIKTLYSCEGHNNLQKFYILFQAPFKLAYKIIKNTPAMFTLSLFDNKYYKNKKIPVWKLDFNVIYSDEIKNEKEKEKAFSRLADAWEKNLNIFKIKNTANHSNLKKNKHIENYKNNFCIKK